ncbi:MAG: pirin family protein [Candidatus Delongbacteria bacterium]
MSLSRATARHHDGRQGQDLWQSFRPPDPADPSAGGFGFLSSLEENRLPPGALVGARPVLDMEILTYVREGVLAQDESSGKTGLLLAGEFQCRVHRRGSRLRERNASASRWAHAFRLTLRPSRAGRTPTCEQKHFPSADRRGWLCVVASPNGRLGSLLVHPDVQLYSTLMDLGQHLVHQLPPGRMAWLHVVEGEIAIGDLVLTSGDGVGVTAEAAVSFTARLESEILLLDLGPDPRAV